MQRYANDFSDQWLLAQATRFFCNIMQYWEADVRDKEFFDIFEKDGNTDMQVAKALFLRHFTPEELLKVGEVRRIEKMLSPNSFFSGKEVDDEDELEEEEETGLDRATFDFDLENNTSDILGNLWNKDKTMRQRVRALLHEWCDALVQKVTRSAGICPIEARFEEVCKMFSLDAVEREILLYAIVRELTCFDDYPLIQFGHNDCMTFQAMAVDVPCSAIVKAVTKISRLIRYNLLDPDFNLRGYMIRDYIKAGDNTMLESAYYRTLPTDEALPWAYYGALAEEHGELLKRLLATSHAGTKGVNILFYGAPGTGKTSFAKTLAKELGSILIEVLQGETNHDKNAMENRMAGLRICNDRFPNNGNKILLVDEADQLLRTSLGFLSEAFGGFSDSSAEKGTINTLLDETNVPTIWIMNAPIDALDTSVRRRFDYSLHFEALGVHQRIAIWGNTLARLQLKDLVSPEWVETFARKYPTSAGGIAMALENVKRLAPEKNAVPPLIERLMAAHCTLMHLPFHNNALLPAKDYTLEGLNIQGDVALERIVRAVRAFRNDARAKADPDRPRMNLLLWGPPGTGKTEFVKHLGKTLDAKIHVKLCGDLLSHWLGDTEHNIKKAFAEAEADNAILFLDEIDGLVQDRTGAEHSWEVTQVNELLQRMENFKGILIGATNFMAHLDAAILRRFTFKLQFDYLNDYGKRHFFERMFHARLTEAEERRLSKIPHLTPGDFRTVRQAIYYLGDTPTHAEYLNELEKESALKRHASTPIGF